MSDLYVLLAGSSTVGERIRRLMEDRGMTLGDLHRASKVAKGYLSELVNETENTQRRKPSAETLFAIGTALSVSVGDLLGKTIPSADDMAEWPPGLEEYVRNNNVPPQEARMLAGISTRGKTPSTSGDWEHIHKTIKMYSLEQRS